MSIPVSKYEELLRQVRGLGQEARQVQSLASPLLNANSEQPSSSENPDVCQHPRNYPENINPSSKSFGAKNGKEIGFNRRLLINRQHQKMDPRHKKLETSGSSNLSVSSHGPSLQSSGEQIDGHPHESDPNTSGPLSNLYHGTWPVEHDTWRNGPFSLPTSLHNNETNSVISFASSAGSTTCPFEVSPTAAVGRSSSFHARSDKDIAVPQLDAKVDIVYGLLAMLGANDGAVDMGHTLLALSSSPESCIAMRKSGCIPLLVQLVYSDCNPVTREQANQALHNLVQFQTDDRILRHETRVLKLLEQIRVYSIEIVDTAATTSDVATNKGSEKHHPIQIIANLMKLSFDEGHRIAICQLGGLQAIAKLIQVDHLAHGSDNDSPQCITLRRYSGMALTNLTFGDSNNKALLCSLNDFMKTLVKQLYSTSEDLKQVTASVLRNLSWRADLQSKQILREAKTVVGLAHAAMNSEKEATLKSILSALWNLSAHCSINKADICNVDGLLAYLVNILNYKSPSKTSSIIENAGGILRNISSHVAVRDDYRQILRDHNCLQILLQQLKSPSLTVVSNACGTLWNLSAKNPEDQKALWDLGAVPMLRSLTHSKHKMISMGSSAALKNLLSARPNGGSLTRLDSTARALGLTALPSLGARKQRALEQELDENMLTETCENIEPNETPSEKLHFTLNELHLGRILSSHSYTSQQRQKDISESRESVTSTHSDSVYERVIRSTRRRRLSPQRERGEVSQSDSLSNLSTPPPAPSSKQKSDEKFMKRYTKHETSWYIKDKGEEPIDYSQKYPECSESGKTKGIEDYGNYAITDLDQPTNYSLRYPDDEDETKLKINDHGDTIKTYCTEGTPYLQTPINFSTATSMNDLRNDLDNDKKMDENIITTPKQVEAHHTNEKESCSVEDITKIIDETAPATNFSSGIISPEKPVNYCEEGTPGYFSRVSSLSSLNSMMNNTEPQPDGGNESGNPLDSDAVGKEVIKTPEVIKEDVREHCKVVTFGDAVNYAQETPLMFSRSSSLASLDSVEQHSIHDDRSSVISDFSRRTSGVVSPSELPDSPTQTIPPTPVRPIRTQNKSPVAPTPRARKMLAPPDPTRIKNPTQLIKSSVFEDTTSTFKDENTPIEFSRCTSLSSLTVDDDIKPTPSPKQNNPEPKSPKQLEETSITEEVKPVQISAVRNLEAFAFNDLLKTYCTEDTPAMLSHAGSHSNLSELSISDNKSFVMKPETLEERSDHDSPDGCSHTDTSNNSIVTNEQEVDHGRLSHLDEDDSSNSADELLLQQCIQAGMNRVTSTAHTINPIGGETSTTSTSRKSVTRNVASLAKKVDEDDEEPAFSDDSYTSADERLLQQCIKAGMARVALNSCIETVIAKDQAKKRLKEVQQEKKNEYADTFRTNNPGLLCEEEEVSSSDDSTIAQKLLQECIEFGIQRTTGSSVKLASIDTPAPTQLAEDDDNASITSADERLLSECINLGIQSVTGEKPQIAQTFVHQSKHQPAQGDFAQQKSKIPSSTPKDKNIYKSTVSIDSASSLNESEKQLLEDCIRDGITRTTQQQIPNSKNGNGSPVAMVTGVKNDTHVEKTHVVIKTQTTTELPIPIVNSWIGEMKNGCDLSYSSTTSQIQEKMDNDLSLTEHYSIDNSGSTEFLTCVDDDDTIHDDTLEDQLNYDYSKARDPDAMIASVDRLTAELVSQASVHYMKQSCGSGNINFNDFGGQYSCNTTTSSTGDLTFPTISATSPVLQSIKSEVVEKTEAETCDMSESIIIASEASNMAAAIETEANLIQNRCYTPLDHIQPPSIMSSIVSLSTNSASSPKMSLRRKLSATSMMRRAITNSTNYTGSLENLHPIQNEDERSASLNLDNIQPPSIMQDMTSDMENSIISVDSICSEIVDETPVPPVAIFLRNGLVNSGTFKVAVPYHEDIEHINPPSYLDEDFSIASSIDQNTICDESMPSSSVESTPTFERKFQSRISKRITPKQRRQITKDRFKTYTVVDPEQLKMATSHNQEDDSSGRGSDIKDELSSDCSSEPKSRNPSEYSSSTLTPNQSPRQRDRERFKTQLLSTHGMFVPFPSASAQKSEDEAYTSLVDTDDNTSTIQCEETSGLGSNSSYSADKINCETGSGLTAANSINSGDYRTYHKSWKCKQTTPQLPETTQLSPQSPTVPNESEVKAKPKITKPIAFVVANGPKTVSDEVQPEVKGIRGRRKPLYSGFSSQIKRPATKIPPNPIRPPIKHITPATKSFSRPQPTVTKKPPPSSSPAKTTSPAKTSPKIKKLERQSTFTKEDTKPSTSKIAKPVERPLPPASPSKIPKGSYIKSKIATTPSAASGVGGVPVKSSQPTKSRLIPPQQRSYSNSSIQGHSGATYLKKKVTPPTTGLVQPSKDVNSKIATLWKKVNQSKAAQESSKVKDKRVWIQGSAAGNQSGSSSSKCLIRSSTFDGGMIEPTPTLAV